MREIKFRALVLLKYRRSKGGLIRNMYSHIKNRSIKNNWHLYFSSNEFYNWCFEQPIFHDLFNKWVLNDYLKDIKPSVDRINCLLPYEFCNMQIVTFIYNRRKGEKEKLILWGKPIKMISPNGEISLFTSTKECSEKTGLRRPNISAVLTGIRNHHKGFKFLYQNPDLLTENT